MTGTEADVSRSRLLVIAGPTASGKTAQAIELAERIGGEIINADSQQVYRHFDIGTGKPSATELARIRHHLISEIDPLDMAFSAARWAALADKAIADIAARGKRAIVVGGTGLYLRVLLHGVVAAPPRDESVRAQFSALADREGNEALHERLRQVDPQSAARLAVADRVRIIRALEIHTLTGTPASTHREGHGFSNDRYDYKLLVLNPERQQLYRRINERAAEFFRGGLVEETRLLVEQGYRFAAPMRSVGYSQTLAVLDGEMTLDEAIADVAQATRKYAKRQMTWFRKEKGARFVESVTGA